MKAAILVEQNRPLVVDEVELPKGLDFGQVHVKLHYTGICGAQINEIDGAKGEDKFLPHLLGHEGSGVVLEVGPGVKRIKPGDHVVLHWRPSDGIASDVPHYRWKGENLNAGWVTTFNSEAIVSENRVTPIPKDFDLKIAPLFGCAVTTGLGVIRNDAKLSIGDSIVVLGAGGVGLNVIQGAALSTAYPIVAVDIFPEKLELAKQFGATHTILSKNVDLGSEIRSIIGQNGADIVVENSGQIEMIEMAYDLTEKEGRTILVGVPKVGKKPSFYSLPLHFGKVLTGSHGGSAKPDRDIPRYIELSRHGKLKLESMISKVMPFEQINEAIAAIRAGKITGRCILQFN